MVRNTDKIAAIDRFERAALRFSDIHEYSPDERQAIILEYLECKTKLMQLMEINL
jgi:hypothetical protein